MTIWKYVVYWLDFEYVPIDSVNQHFAAKLCYDLFHCVAPDILVTFYQ